MNMKKTVWRARWICFCSQSINANILSLTSRCVWSSKQRLLWQTCKSWPLIDLFPNRCRKSWVACFGIESTASELSKNVPDVLGRHLHFPLQHFLDTLLCPTPRLKAASLVTWSIHRSSSYWQGWCNHKKYDKHT